jgi:hypothetical protein
MKIIFRIWCTIGGCLDSVEVFQLCDQWYCFCSVWLISVFDGLLEQLMCVTLSSYLSVSPFVVVLYVLDVTCQGKTLMIQLYFQYVAYPKGNGVFCVGMFVDLMLKIGKGKSGRNMM